jgi:hypothetical protein
MFSVNSFLNNRDDKLFKYFIHSNKSFTLLYAITFMEVIRKDSCNDHLISTKTFSQNSIAKLISNFCVLNEFDLTCRL